MSKNRNWLYLAILSFVLAVVWAGVSAYSRAHQSTIPPDIEKIMTPLNPKLNTAVLDKIKERSQ